MTVKELKEMLADLPETYEVILSADSEGNTFSPVSDHELHMYVPETTWCGEVRCEEDCEEGEYKENAVVLWPTN